MVNLNEHKSIFIDREGTLITYPFTTSMNERDIVEDYCKKKEYDFPSEDTIMNFGDIHFKNGGNGVFVVFMPETISDDQLYVLDGLNESIDKFKYLGSVKKGSNVNDRCEFIEDVWNGFSEKVIQSYFKKGI